MFNNQLNLDRINNQIRELEALRQNYQQMPQQPIQNIINTGNTQNIEFEARILKENEKVDEIIVQRKTAFIDLNNGKLSIKELNGDIQKYEVILPKTPEQLKIEELERKLEKYEYEFNKSNNEKFKPDTSDNGDNEPTTKTNGRNVPKKS